MDDLDKIPQRVLGDVQKTTNHEQLFLRLGRLRRSLRCDVLYTIPIELAFSNAQNELVNTFGGSILNLPVIALRTRDGGPDEAAVAALRRIYQRRVAKVNPSDVAIFSDDASLPAILESTGGHVRSLCIALREILTQVDGLPIDNRVVARAFSRLTRNMRRGLQPGDREVLLDVDANCKGAPIRRSTACCAMATSWPTRTTRATGTDPIRGSGRSTSCDRVVRGYPGRCPERSVGDGRVDAPSPPDEGFLAGVRDREPHVDAGRPPRQPPCGNRRPGDSAAARSLWTGLPDRGGRRGASPRRSS